MACSVAKAQTITVSGLQSGVWEADTVIVTDNVKVQDTLAVAAGTTVLFDGFHSIIVGDNMVFMALGSETDSVVFTVADTTGFHVYNTGKGGWNGFQIDKAGRFLLDHCVLEYGKAADTLDRFGGALFINNCDEIKDFAGHPFKIIKAIGQIPFTAEGVRKENLFGISLIGPVLVKNPFFADHIVKLITERRKAEFKAIFYKYEERSYEMTLRALT